MSVLHNSNSDCPLVTSPPLLPITHPNRLHVSSQKNPQIHLVHDSSMTLPTEEVQEWLTRVYCSSREFPGLFRVPTLSGQALYTCSGQLPFRKAIMHLPLRASDNSSVAWALRRGRSCHWHSTARLLHGSPLGVPAMHRGDLRRAK